MTSSLMTYLVISEFLVMSELSTIFLVMSEFLIVILYLFVTKRIGRYRTRRSHNPMGCRMS